MAESNDNYLLYYICSDRAFYGQIELETPPLM